MSLIVICNLSLSYPCHCPTVVRQCDGVALLSITCNLKEKRLTVCVTVQVTAWAKQREIKLEEGLAGVRSNTALLDELMAWITQVESSLLTQEQQPIPDNVPIIEQLLHDHQVTL